MSTKNSQLLNNDFIMEIMKACLQNKNMLEISLSHIKDNFLPEGSLEDIFKEIRKQYKVFEKRPTIGTLKLALRKNHDAMELLDEIKEMQEVDIDVILSSLEEFIKTCNYIDIYNKSSDFYNRNEQKKAYDIFIKGAEDISKFSLKEETYTNVFGDFEIRQTERVSKTDDVTKIPSGIDELDRAINGGFETGQLIVWVARSKGGKSFGLNHCGMHSARLGHDTVHFQLEGTKKECLDRYDALWSGNLYKDVKDGNFSDKSLTAFRKITNNLRSDISVYAPEKFGAMTVIELRNRIIDLRKKRDIKTVIIDYLELLDPDDNFYRPSEERFRQSKVARMLKDLALEFNILIITATQSSSITKEMYEDPDFVISEEHLSEDKGKLRPIDMLLSINRTSEEKRNHIARISIAAARAHHGTDEPIYIKQNLKASRFYDRKNTLLEMFSQSMPNN